MSGLSCRFAARSVLLLLAFATPALAQEQPVGTSNQPVTCDSKAASAKKQWASSSHGNLANVFHKQRYEMGDTWCRIWETKGRERSFKVEDFARTLFTGSGVHPIAASSLVPGTGLAGGVALNLEHNAISAPLRFSEGIRSLYAWDGSWSVSGNIQILGSAPSTENRHSNAEFYIQYRDLAALPPFGVDPKLNVPSINLRQSLASVLFEKPLPLGVAASVTLSGLSSVSSQSEPGSQASLTGSTNQNSTYVIVGPALRWRHPSDAVTEGVESEAAAAVRQFHSNSNQAPSFLRSDFTWLTQYAGPSVFGAIAATFNAASLNGNNVQSVPAYLQPTLGGTDLDGFSALRSFSDYRFRGTKRVAVLFEHERDIWGPIASILFVGWGQTAGSFSDVRFASLHHSYGAGVAIRAGNTTFLRIFFAFGDEGFRPTIAATSDVFANGNGVGLPFSISK